MAYESDRHLFPVWREPRSVWERPGLTPAQERVVDVALVLVLAIFLAGWVYAAADAVERGEAPSVARQLGAPGSMVGRSAPSNATFAMNALMERLIDWEEVRGESGEVRLILQQQGDTLALPTVPEDLAVTYVPTDTSETAAAFEARDTRAPTQPGMWNLLLQIGQAIREVPRLSLVTLVPASELESGFIGEYRIGDWPDLEGAYAPPAGFVEVTPDNMNTYVSTHFQLKDFLTKGQEGVWPKYVALSPRLLDKLELTLQELERRGHPVENVFVISGFRTPWYNEFGGTTQGRGALSRHMYGDAADIAIDNDGDACMDDLTGDGSATIADARVLADAAEQVERDFPHLVGGIGIYAPVAGSHCGMVHIDTRGNRARW